MMRITCGTHTSFSSFAPRFPQESQCFMLQKELTFNDLPQVVAQLREEVVSMKALLLSLQKQNNQQPRENRHRTVTPEQLAEFTPIPLSTIYQKLEHGDIPASKPGKRWGIFLDDVDKWLEVNRKNPIAQTDEEINEGITSSHRRKARTPEWAEEVATLSFDKHVRTKNVRKEKTETPTAEPTAESSTSVEAESVTASIEKTSPVAETSDGETPPQVEEIPALISFEQMASAYPKPDKPGNYLTEAMRLWESFDSATRQSALVGVKGYVATHPRFTDQVFLNQYLRQHQWQSNESNNPHTFCCGIICREKELALKGIN